jgi:dienelactone hydrolase
MQGVREPTFQRLDMGSVDANEARYGTPTPPPYDMSKIAVPTAVFWGKHDWLADPDDVQKILTTVPSEMLVYVKEQTTFAHLDYTWAPAARTEVYDDVVKLLNQYVPQ